MLPTRTDTLTVVIADDHPLFREGVIAALATDPDITVVGEADHADAAVHLARQGRPDVVLLDLSMPGDGLRAVSRIIEAAPSTRVIMLTASDDEEHLLSAIRAGARGYVLKGVEVDDLVKIIRSVHAGDVYVAPSMAFDVLREVSRPMPPDPLDALAARERDVLELVAGGLDNQEIAARLGLAEQTVKQYMTSILRKLRVGTRVEAAVLAARLGLGPESPAA
jgi:two-component system, NarL family, nitrate/nitrite response regulator NarL